MELLGTREPEHPWSTILIDGHFDIGQKLGRILNFIDQNRRRKSLHKECRIILGKGKNEGIVQSDIPPIYPFRCSQLVQERGFTDLTCPCDQHCGEKSRCSCNV